MSQLTPCHAWTDAPTAALAFGLPPPALKCDAHSDAPPWRPVAPPVPPSRSSVRNHTLSVLLPQFVAMVRPSDIAATGEKGSGYHSIRGQRGFECKAAEDAWLSELHLYRRQRAALAALSLCPFRSLKKGWNEVQKIEAAIKGDENRRNNRRLKSRARKSHKLSKKLNAFAAKHGLNPGFLADVVHEQFLSDEASGPEDEVQNRILEPLTPLDSPLNSEQDCRFETF
ncbi:hypothetical protein B0H11DRAFT_1914826 [Mycena galericulata]|nr:hypothetical protein B0H11DRAFT_1914826 [Mycena galericulata]